MLTFDLLPILANWIPATMLLPQPSIEQSSEGLGQDRAFHLLILRLLVPLFLPASLALHFQVPRVPLGLHLFAFALGVFLDPWLAFCAPLRLQP